jgi:hypothetical protein
VLLDVRADLLDTVRRDLAGELGFALDPEHVTLSGTCAACRRRPVDTPVGAPTRPPGDSSADAQVGAPTTESR